MPDSVVFVADAGEEAGLGHISRSSAIAVALRCRGIDTRCHAYGVEKPLERDGVTWLASADLPAFERVLVVDSYRFPHERLAEAAGSTRLVVMHDFGGVPEGAALVVSAAAPPSADDAEQLTGLAFAALRPGFWGLPARKVRGTVERVLVTTGSGQFGDLGRDVAQALAAALPHATVALVRGPHATVTADAGVNTIDAPDSLLEPLLASDLVVTGGGQTMLEAAAAGTPSIALP
ncbi:MAG: hypothetical protein M3P18_07045, partial [Actinomycetota bacterium]|nr:hypothetical protein [Actinomycetota bacterium]